MSDRLLALTHLRHLRAEARHYSLETLTDILDKFTIIVEERREELANEGAQALEHARKIDKIREMMLSEGIDITELCTPETTTNQENNKQRQQRPAKYQYTDSSGQRHTWSGQGRTPRIIQQALDQGINLENFLISD